MRVQELYDQVAGLGFEKSLEDDDWFYQAANRALLQVNILRPAISSYVINHRPMKNLVKSGFSPVQLFSELTYEADNAKSYYFQADGNGILNVERFDADANAWVILNNVTLSGNGQFKEYFGFIKDGAENVKGRVRLRFSGEFLYSIKNVALYEYIYSNETADIPAYEAYTAYDLSKLTEDFLTLATPPIIEDEEYEKLSGDYEVEGNNILLFPYDVSGCFKVLYHRKPEKIDNTIIASENESLIDLDEELCTLLPVLIASYIWLEDEPDRAQYYYNLYQARAAEIVSRSKKFSPVHINSCNNW